MNRILNMFLRQVMQQFVSKGIDASAQDGQPMTKAQKQSMKRMRQSARLMRRMTRF